MPNKKLDKHIDVNSIPTLPAVAMEAIRLMEGEQSSFDSIADLLRNDQVLSGRILHYANSSFVGARSEISTISRAISQLGFNTVRSIILSVSVFDCFADKAVNKDDLVGFWLHSIGVAATAEILAERLGFAVPEEAYLAGLVHDLGKLVCFLHLPADFARLCKDLEKNGSYSTGATLALGLEDEIMGTTHTEVGRLVADQWLFPEALAKSMWLHHQPVFEPIKPEEANLHQLIRFADVLCVTHNIGSSYFLSSNPYDHQNFHFALENLMMHHHLESAELGEIIHRVVERVQEVATVLGISDAEKYRRLVSSANVSLGSMSINLERKNRELASANRVLDATYKMTRKLKPGLTIAEAAQEIIYGSREAFGVARCLCLVLDKDNGQFVGQLYDAGEFNHFVVPVSCGKGERTSVKNGGDLAYEAVRRLREVAADFDQGGLLESGVADIIAGSEFMASFFVGDKKSHGRPDRIIGELMLDFKGADTHFEEMEDISRNFEVLATAAANGAERILLEKDLQCQAREMAESSRKMEESQRQLFHSHRLATVGSLAAGAAHEINNPLTIISLNLQIMERMLDQGNESELRKRLGVISGQEQRISRIIGELMGFARPSQPKLGPVDLSDVVGNILSVIGDRVSMVKIEVVNDILPDLPQALIDANQIEQVFMNLLINANHSMPDGGTIVLRSEVEEHFVAVSVTDSGAGISKENLGKIFDPFFTTKKEGEGTGLGLAICHSIVEHNGGSLQVRSEEGKGATFTVRLPIDRGNKLRAMKKAVDQDKKKQVSTAEDCRVLIVDDERMLNDMLQECLIAAGYEVDGAYDGVEGIGLLRYKKYHLILLDIRMPRKDGLEVLQFVKDEYPDIPVIIITGLASIEEIKETVKKGAFACIKKPFLLDKVLKKVDEALVSKCKKKR